tara:strand:- start:308 stop:1048 length:741 start_codon:yes stop_codon:yes gene_type:complete
LVDKVEMPLEEKGAEAPEPLEEEVKASEEKPKWLPDKFKTPEDMAKAYGELEKQFTKERQETKETEETNSLEIEAKETVENAGLNFEELSESYAKNGELSEAEYSKLESQGISKDLVDQYIAGQQAIANNVQNEIYNNVGGQEAYTNMVQWATDNMSEGEISAYNQAVNSDNRASIDLAVQGLKARYDSANGREPSLLGGRATQNVGESYESWAQVTADMNLPQYQSDPAFRQKVQEKIGRSGDIS